MTTTQNNEAFDKMTQAEKRVAIAHDVIVQVKAKTLIAKEQTWLGGLLFDTLSSAQVRDVLPEKCTVCALGSIFVSANKMFDQLTCQDLHEDSSIRTRRDLSLNCGKGFRYLVGFFDEDQLKLIEMAFEGGGGAFNDYDVSDEELPTEEAMQFYDNFEDPGNRLVAIMQNIIDHNGEFVPTAETAVTS